MKEFHFLFTGTSDFQLCVGYGTVCTQAPYTGWHRGGAVLGYGSYVARFLGMGHQGLETSTAGHMSSQCAGYILYLVSESPSSMKSVIVNGLCFKCKR